MRPRRRPMARRRQSRAGDAGKVVAYIRVSTDEQALGPEVQEAAIARWCETHRKQRVATYRDLGVSGAAPLDRRPGLASALDALAELGAGVLLVAKRDRLARDVMTAAYVEATVKKSGASVVSTAGEGEGDDPAAVLMRRMVDAFAEYERALIRARTRAALAVKRSRGERAGNVPFGKAPGEGPRLAEEPGELATIARARSLRAEGLSYHAVRRRLELEGHRGRTGRPLAYVQVYNICNPDRLRRAAS
jgi:site-specific DNA recombinase